MNFNDFKTTNLSYFPRVGSSPSWKLNFSGNVWDALMDQVGALFAAYYPFSSSPTSTTTVSVGASPFTYTAGTDPEVVYISGGIVSSLTRNGVSITGQMPCTVFLPPGGQFVCTYTSAPTIISDAGGTFNNAAGITAAITVTSSPFTYTAGGRAEIVYISGGAVSSITRNGIAISGASPCTVVIPRGGTIVVTYSSAPLMVSDS